MGHIKRAAVTPLLLGGRSLSSHTFILQQAALLLFRGYFTRYKISSAASCISSEDTPLHKTTPCIVRYKAEATFCIHTRSAASCSSLVTRLHSARHGSSTAVTMASTTVIPDYMVWLVWDLLTRAPRVTRAASAIREIESEDQLEELMEDSSSCFADGLVDALQSSVPPTVEFFKGLPSSIPITGVSWGVYAIVLEKQGHRPHVYVGSGTHMAKGLFGRLKEYDIRFHLPTKVEELLNEGYTITHKGLFCWAPLPRNAIRLDVRNLYLIMECTFSLVFWTMKSKRDDYGMPHICPWPLKSLTYDGCCTHASMKEGLREGASKGLTGAALEDYYNGVEKRRAETSKLWHRAFKIKNFEA